MYRPWTLDCWLRWSVENILLFTSIGILNICNQSAQVEIKKSLLFICCFVTLLRLSCVWTLVGEDFKERRWGTLLGGFKDVLWVNIIRTLKVLSLLIAYKQILIHFGWDLRGLECLREKRETIALSHKLTTSYWKIFGRVRSKWRWRYFVHMCCVVTIELKFLLFMQTVIRVCLWLRISTCTVFNIMEWPCIRGIYNGSSMYPKGHLKTLFNMLVIKTHLSELI